MWTGQYLKNSWLGGVLMACAILGGTVLTRPGWNVRPAGSLDRALVSLGLLSVGGVLAAVVLKATHVALPYNPSELRLMKVAPGMVALVAAEEFLFRQVMFRWLETHGVSPRLIVGSTALVFGLAHLGQAFDPSNPLRLFTCFQAAYLILIGCLLGDLRRTSGSWLVSSMGHLTYNVSLLLTLAIASPMVAVKVW
jgi:Type II CAAX prenyl endopeptidase Rce1-like